jgi:hypothetical protein
MNCHRYVLYGETELTPMIIQAEKRTITYLEHIQKLDLTNIVKYALLEQEETLLQKPETKNWLNHAYNCCNK